MTNWNDSIKLEEQTRRHSPPELAVKYAKKKKSVGIIKNKIAKLEAFSAIMYLVVGGL